MRYLLIIASIGFLASCSPKLTPFTQDLYDQNRWSEQELKKIQFYLSEDIILRRQYKEGESTIAGGKIRMVDGREVEEIIFRKGTPGVLLFTPRTNRFAISFESNGEDRYLMFGPNPKAGDRYVLLAKDWDRRTGRVSYDDKVYTTTSSSAFSHLLVDLRRINKLEVERRTAGGRTIDN